LPGFSIDHVELCELREAAAGSGYYLGSAATITAT